MINNALTALPYLGTSSFHRDLQFEHLVFPAGKAGKQFFRSEITTGKTVSLPERRTKDHGLKFKLGLKKSGNVNECFPDRTYARFGSCLIKIADSHTELIESGRTDALFGTK